MVFVERFVADNVGIRISAAAIFTVSNDSAVNRSGPLFVLPPITMVKVASESSLIDPLFVLSVICGGTTVLTVSVKELVTDLGPVVIGVLVTTKTVPSGIPFVAR